MIYIFTYYYAIKRSLRILRRNPIFYAHLRNNVNYAVLARGYVPPLRVLARGYVPPLLVLRDSAAIIISA